MNEWLMGVIGTALFSALVCTLCPQGGARQVLGFLCAMLCALSLAGPLLELDLQSLGIGMAEYRRQAERIAADAEEEGKLTQRTYIQEQAGAYILSEAQELGLAPAEPQVSAQWDAEAGLWYPCEVLLPWPYQRALAQTIEAELGISEERQTWTE